MFVKTLVYKNNKLRTSPCIFLTVLLHSIHSDLAWQPCHWGRRGRGEKQDVYSYPSSNKNKNNDACISVITKSSALGHHQGLAPWLTAQGGSTTPRQSNGAPVRDSCFDLRNLMPTSFWGRCVIEEEKEQYHPNYYDRAPSHFHNKFMLISWAPLQFRYCAPTLKPPRQSEEIKKHKVKD